MSVLNDMSSFHFLGTIIKETCRFIFVPYWSGPEAAFMFTSLNSSKMCILMPSKLADDYYNGPIVNLPYLYVV